MANIGFDHFNKYILHDEADLDISVQELYDACKEEEAFPHIAMTTGIIVDATGKDPLGGLEFTGITLVLRNGWTFKCRTVPASPIVIKVSGGNTIAEGANDLITTVANVHYVLAQATSPALIQTAGVLTPTQQEIRDASALATADTIIAGSLDDKLNELLILDGNTQNWETPGLLKIYADGEVVGGTTFAEFETRDSLGVQTFVLADVKQLVRTK